MDAPDETSHMVVHSVIHTYAAAICYTNFVQSKLNTWPCPCAMCFHLSTWCASTCLRCWRTPSSPIMWPSIILLLTGALTGPYICAGQTKWQTCAGELHGLHSRRYFYNFQNLGWTFVNNTYLLVWFWINSPQFSILTPSEHFPISSWQLAPTIGTSHWHWHPSVTTIWSHKPTVATKWQNLCPTIHGSWTET